MKKLLLMGAIFFGWPAIAFADDNGWGNIGNWGHTMPFWWVRTFMWILFLVVIVVVVYSVLQSIRPKSRDSSFGETAGETPVDILKDPTQG
jgi:uncharacterized membrane protein